MKNRYQATRKLLLFSMANTRDFAIAVQCCIGQIVGTFILGVSKVAGREAHKNIPKTLLFRT